MVTKDALKNGLLSYIDSDIIPHLSNPGKWGISALIFIFLSKFEVFLNEIQKNSLFKSLGIIDENGMIDADLLTNALISSAEKYGKLTLTIPLLGTFTFLKEDIEKVRDNIIENGG